jgi:hypothetical protein
MITLALYHQLPGPSNSYCLNYYAYFLSEEDLIDMAQRVILEGKFSSEQDKYMLVVSYNSKEKQTYYAKAITWEMNVIFRDYKKQYNKAYELAKARIWPVAWKMGGQKYRINCALLQMAAAREQVTAEK